MDVVVFTTMAAPASVQCASVLDVTELEATEALDEGGEVVDADALMPYVDASLFQHPDADVWTHFEDDVDCKDVAIAASEPELDVVRTLDRGRNGGVLTFNDVDASIEIVLRSSVRRDPFQDDERTSASGRFGLQ